MSMRSHTRSNFRRRRGVAAVELAFTMIPLLLAAFGVSEYGRMLYTFNALDKSVRDAVRYATAPPGSSTDLLAEVRRIVVYGNLAGTGPRLAPNLDEDMVTMCNRDSCADHRDQDTGVAGANGVLINMITVRITGYEYRSAVTYAAPGRVAFNTISATMRSN